MTRLEVICRLLMEPLAMVLIEFTTFPLFFLMPPLLFHVVSPKGADGGIIGFTVIASVALMCAMIIYLFVQLLKRMLLTLFGFWLFVVCVILFFGGGIASVINGNLFYFTWAVCFIPCAFVIGYLLELVWGARYLPGENGFYRRSMTNASFIAFADITQVCVSRDWQSVSVGRFPWSLLLFNGGAQKNLLLWNLFHGLNPKVAFLRETKLTQKEKDGHRAPRFYSAGQERKPGNFGVRVLLLSNLAILSVLIFLLSFLSAPQLKLLFVAVSFVFGGAFVAALYYKFSVTEAGLAMDSIFEKQLIPWSEIQSAEIRVGMFSYLEISTAQKRYRLGVWLSDWHLLVGTLVSHLPFKPEWTKDLPIDPVHFLTPNAISAATKNNS